MLKNWLAALCFLLVLTGCSSSDNFQYGSNPVKEPVKQADTLRFGILDEDGMPFKGAMLLLVGSSGKEYQVAINGAECLFNNIPYGNYKLSIPGYSNQVYDLQVAENYVSQDFVFSHILIGVTVKVSGTIGDWDVEEHLGDIDVFIAGPVRETKMALNTVTKLFEAKVPKGHYYLWAADGGSNIGFSEADVDAGKTSFAIAVQEYEHVSVIFVPMKPAEISALLDSKRPLYISYDPYYREYSLVFAAADTSYASNQTLYINAEGFKEYTKKFPSAYYGDDYNIMLTPLGAKDTVAIASIEISDGNGVDIAVDSVMSVTLNGLPPDFISYVPEYKDGSGTYPAHYQAIYYLDSDEFADRMNLIINSSAYQQFSDTVDLSSGVVNYPAAGLIPG